MISQVPDMYPHEQLKVHSAVQGNSGETQKFIFKAYNSAGKLGGNSGETQKIIFIAYKSAGKLGGNSKNHFYSL